MFALAIILLAIVAVLVVASFVGTSEQVVIEFANVTITSSVGGVFVTGVIAGLVALASLVALKVSISRRRQHNKEVRELRRRAERAAPATTTTGPDIESDRAPGGVATRDAGSRDDAEVGTIEPRRDHADDTAVDRRTEADDRQTEDRPPT